MGFRTFVATEAAITRARALGLFGNTAMRLARAARRSAMFRGEEGNRRFHDFILTVRATKSRGSTGWTPASRSS